MGGAARPVLCPLRDYLRVHPPPPVDVCQVALEHHVLKDVAGGVATAVDQPPEAVEHRQGLENNGIPQMEYMKMIALENSIACCVLKRTVTCAKRLVLSNTDWVRTWRMEVRILVFPPICRDDFDDRQAFHLHYPRRLQRLNELPPN